MPQQPTVPGLYVSETPADRSVAFLPPGPALFVGEAAAGPLDRCEKIASPKQMQSLYGAPSGGLAAAVALCLANGGGPVLVLRVAGAQNAAPAERDYRAAFDWLRRDGPRFGLLALPVGSDRAARPQTLYAAASELCRQRRAILLLDPPESWSDVGAALGGLKALAAGVVLENAALYLPPLLGADGTAVGPAGAVAGVILRSDRQQGVWKAPAGSSATLDGVAGLAWPIAPHEQAPLGAEGINAIRAIGAKPQLWGARTLAGADRLASDWKYLTVRRLALAIEDSLALGLAWVVFEPNDEPLWAAVRTAAATLMHELFRAGAFAGQSERDSWFLRCDGTTMTAADIAAGRLLVQVGFAPLRPAEFIVLRLGFRTGDDRT